MSEPGSAKPATVLTKLIRNRYILLCISAVTLLSACGVYVPKGSTVVEIENVNREFDRAELRPVDELRSGELIRMKWYSTNTYITSATLQPGTYSFRARRYQGGGLERQIEVVSGKNLYTVDGGSGESANNQAETGGPAISGKITLSAGQRLPSTVSILFIGEQIEMRSAPVAQDGSFSSNAPRRGMWRVEVHALGNPPHSYVKEKHNIQGPLNLGNITLQ